MDEIKTVGGPKSRDDQSAAGPKPEAEPQGGRLRLSDIPKYAAMVGFGMYVFGFLIWHSYLAQFGMSPPSVWKLEFLSASICYFALALGISFPPALLLARVPLGALRHRDLFNASRIPIYPLFALWAFLWIQINSVFFGGLSSVSIWFWGLVALWGIYVHVLLLLRHEE